MRLPRIKPLMWIPVTAFMVLIMSLVTAGEWGYRSYRHCIFCRTVRVQHSYCGYRWDEYRDNLCTDWYRTHIATNHNHLWVRPGTSSCTYDAFGRTVGLADNIDHLSALLLTPEEQIEVYRRIDDPRESVQLFSDLHTYVIAKDKRGHVMASVLKQWVAEDPTATVWSDLKDRMTETRYDRGQFP